MNRSVWLLVSPVTRFEALLVNSILLPSADRATKFDSPLASAPVEVVDRRVTSPVFRSFSKMSVALLVSPLSRFEPSLSKMALLPSVANQSRSEKRPFDTAPWALADTAVTAPVVRFLTKMSLVLLVSPAVRLVASLSKKTWLSSVVTPSPEEFPLACTPADVVDTRVMAPVVRFLMNRSVALLVSPATRLEPSDSKPTRLLSCRKSPAESVPLLCTPVALVSTWVTTPVVRFLT